MTATMIPVAPERSLVQRMDALTRANEIRTKRANLKRDVKAGRASVHALLLEPPEYMETAKVFDLLMACPKYGRVKVNRVLQVCRISPSKTVGGLSGRQRVELISMLRHTTPVDPALWPRSDRQQFMHALDVANATRLDRAQLKDQIAAGERTVASVLRDELEVTDTMTIADLLMSQHRWGRARCRRFLTAVRMLETKTIGSMTERQRHELIGRLDETPAAKR